MPDKLRRIGLALGSGSAKGWSHIGVIRGLQEANIAVDIVCGSSIGALSVGRAAGTAAGGRGAGGTGRTGAGIGSAGGAGGSNGPRSVME